MIRTAIAVVLVVPGLLLSICKGVAYFYGSVRDTHHLMKMYFTPLPDNVEYVESDDDDSVEEILPIPDTRQAEDDRDLITTSIESIEHSTSRYKELRAKGRQVGARIDFRTFKEVEKQLAIYKTQYRGIEGSKDFIKEKNLKLHELEQAFKTILEYEKFWNADLSSKINLFSIEVFADIATDITDQFFFSCDFEDIRAWSCVSKCFYNRIEREEFWQGLCHFMKIRRQEGLSCKKLCELELSLKKFSGSNQIFLRALTGKTTTLCVDFQSPELKLIHCKRLLKQQNSLSCSLDEMRIIFAGKELQNDQLVSGMKWTDITVVHLVISQQKIS
jgi:hypothetical protein